MAGSEVQAPRCAANAGAILAFPSAVEARGAAALGTQRRTFKRCQMVLVTIFFLTLPFVNPWVRGDGVGYYAYVRSLLIERSLNFENDWKAANESFAMGRLEGNGHVLPSEYTSAGHIANNWSVGPSLLWAPFLICTHVAVLTFDKFGGHVRADGFSKPYLLTMALATAFYGFLGLLLSFRLASKYFEARWAFLATTAIWFASSLPVYMYFNPSWAHAQSAFVVALFLWYWHRTRGERSPAQWALLGLISGLMVNVYYPNGVLLLLPVFEAFAAYGNTWKLSQRARPLVRKLFSAHILYLVVFLVATLPTLITRQIIYGGPLRTGYVALSEWNWSSPALVAVLFSSDHGMLTWTPILALALLGLFFLRKHDHSLANSLSFACLAYYYLIASHVNWDGLSSFGNRFFISMTPVFVLGLAATFDALSKTWKNRGGVLACTYGSTLLFIAWNLGFIFQWGTHLVPARGPISWREMAHNQVAVVPVRLTATMTQYLTSRRALMGEIEREDVRQLTAPAAKEENQK